MRFGSKEVPRENGASKRRRRGEGKKGRKKFPSFPSPTPIFHFWLSLPIFRAGKRQKIPFFAPKPHGNACYTGYDQEHHTVSSATSRTRTAEPRVERTCALTMRPARPRGIPKKCCQIRESMNIPIMTSYYSRTVFPKRPDDSEEFRQNETSLFGNTRWTSDYYKPVSSSCPSSVGIMRGFSDLC